MRNALRTIDKGQLGTVFILIILITIAVGCDSGDTFVTNTNPPETNETSRGPEVPRSQVDPRLKPDFQNESDLINFEGNLLSSYKTEFFNLEVINHPEVSEFNFRTFEEGAQEIILSGKDIVLIEGSKLYESLGGKEGLVSALKVSIFADTLTIASPLWLQSANLEIKARVLTFENDGSISTAGIRYPQPIDQFKKGIDGSKGGDIKLAVKTFNNNSKNKTLFDLTGGHGAMGGAGRHGTAGGNVPVLEWVGERAVVYKEQETCQQIIRNGGFSGGFAKRMNGNSRCTFTIKKGVRVHAGHGTDAIAGGAPGLGGASGKLTVSNDEMYEKALSSEFTLLKGGKSANAHPTYKGGAVGSPQTTCFVWDYQGGHPDTWQCQTATPGADAASPVAMNAVGPEGELELNKDLHWLSEKALNFLLASARERFLSQNFEKAKAEYEKVVDLVKEAPEKSLGLLKAESRALEQLEKLYRHQDYFQKSSHWVPHLSLEASLISFEETLDKSFQGLWLSYWLANRNESLEQKQKKVENQVSRLRVRENSLRSDLETLSRRLTNSRDSLSEIRVKEQHFQKTLFELDRLLKEQAQQNIKIPHAKKAVALLGALSRSIPVGQPAFGLVGDSLDFMVGTFESEDRLSYAFEKLPELYERVGNTDFEEAALEWNAAWKSLSFDDFKSMEREERLKLLKQVGKFYGPIVKEVGATYRDLKEREISKDRFSRELERLRSAHSHYQKITGELELLVQEKRRYREAVLELLSQLSSASLELTEVYGQMDGLLEEGTIISLALSPAVKRYLEKMGKKHEERILESFHQLVRAFEYRSLTPYQGSLNLEPLRLEALRLAEKSNSREVSFYEFESLRSLYDEITVEIRNTIESADMSSRVSDYFWVHLDEAHLAELSKGSDVYVSLDKFIVDDSLEDYRFNKITFENAPLVEFDWDDRFWGTLSLHIVPVSGFHLKRGDDSFFFRFSEEYQASRGFWGVAMDLWGEGFESLAPSVSGLRRVMQSYSGVDLGEANYLAHDGVRTTLRISPSKKFSTEKPISIKEVRFKVHYTARRGD